MTYGAYAISEIIENLRDKALKKFDVVVYGRDKNLYYLAQKIIENFANGNVTHTVKFEQKSRGKKNRIKMRSNTKNHFSIA